MSQSPDERLMAEWTKTRETIQIFDDKLYELRKYGFSFITALLTIQGLLLPYIAATVPVNEVVTTITKETILQNGNATTKNSTTSENTPVDNSDKTPSSGLPDAVKIAILGVTSLLIVAVKWLDGQFQAYQHAAALRAKTIERLLGLELTNQLSLRYEFSKLWRAKLFLYSAFHVAVLGLFFAVVPIPIGSFSFIAFVIFIILMIAEWFFYLLVISPDSLSSHAPPSDWTIDRVQVQRGEVVRIMMTNLCPRSKPRWVKKRCDNCEKNGDRVLSANKFVWQIMGPDGKKYPENPLSQSQKVVRDASVIWSWKVPWEAEVGIYRLEVDMDLGPGNGQREIPAKILVIEKPLGQKTIEKSKSDGSS